MQDPGTLSLFESIMLPHLDAAYNLARWLTRNEHDAEDVVQEAYLRAFRFFDGFDGGDGKGWLMTIVRNTWRTRAQRAAERQAFEPFDEASHGLNHNGGPDAERRLITEAELQSLRTCLEDLPPDFREVIVLRELEDCSYKDIAAVVSLPIGTVMSRLARARKRLQECLQSRFKGAHA